MKKYKPRTALSKAFKEHKIDKRILVKQLGSSVNSLNQVISGARTVSAARAKRIEELTAGKITRVMLRPDLFESCVPYNGV